MKTAVLQEVWASALKASPTSRVREAASMVEMMISTIPTAPRSAKASTCSDAVFQSSADFSDSQRVTSELTQNTISSWRHSG